MSEATFTRMESKRLILSRFEDSDLTPFAAYRNDPKVARYQSWDSCDEHRRARTLPGRGRVHAGAGVSG